MYCQEADLDTNVQKDCKSRCFFKFKCYRPEEPAVLGKLWYLLQKLEEQHVIRKSTSEWEFPAAAFVKKNGKVQLCADYRQLNKQTLEKDKYQVCSSEMAHLAWNSLQGAQYFAYFDLAFWYQQVNISEGDTEKTAFMTPFGLYEHLRIPFGLANGQGTLQQLVYNLFGDFMFQKSLVIGDDFLLFSCDFNKHMKDVEELLSRVTKANLTIRPKSMAVGYTFRKYCQVMEKSMTEKTN